MLNNLAPLYVKPIHFNLGFSGTLRSLFVILRYFGNCCSVEQRLKRVGSLHCSSTHKKSAFEHRCERSLLHTTRNSNVCTYFKLQRKSTVENEIDGCHKGLKNDMCATYSADLELHSMCSSIYHMYYYVVCSTYSQLSFT